MLRRSILLHLSAVPNTRPAPFPASRAPTHGAQLTPAADATLGHLVDLGVENQVEPTTASKETYYSVKRDLLQCELVKSPEAQVELNLQQPGTQVRPKSGFFLSHLGTRLKVFFFGGPAWNPLTRTNSNLKWMCIGPKCYQGH